jgi:hypothetical protein
LHDNFRTTITTKIVTVHVPYVNVM